MNRTILVAAMVVTMMACGGSSSDDCKADADHPWCVKARIEKWQAYKTDRPTETASTLTPGNTCVGGWWPGLQRDGKCVDVIEIVDGPFCRHDIPDAEEPAVGIYSRPCSTEQAIGCADSEDQLARWCWVFPGGWPLSN